MYGICVFLVVSVFFSIYYNRLTNVKDVKLYMKDMSNNVRQDMT